MCSSLPQAMVGLGKTRQKESLPCPRAIGPAGAARVHFLGYPNNGLTQLWQPDHWRAKDRYLSPTTHVSASPYANEPDAARGLLRTASALRSADACWSGFARPRSSSRIRKISIPTTGPPVASSNMPWPPPSSAATSGPRRPSSTATWSTGPASRSRPAVPSASTCCPRATSPEPIPVGCVWTCPRR